MHKTTFKLVPFKTTANKLPDIVIRGTIASDQEHISVDYFLVGDGLEAIAINPISAEPCRKDQLWEHTCFEVFITGIDNPQYWEYNLSPSHDWSVFRFSDYRQNKTDELSINNIVINTERKGEQGFSVHGLLPLPKPLVGKKLQIGVSAVIQDINDVIYYYALTHLGQQADFHDKNSFILNFE